MDIRPLSPGHTLVIPKKHFRWVWEVPAIGSYFEVVQKIAVAIKKAFDIEAVHAKIVGEEVHHAHIWIYPDPAAVHGDKTAFEDNAEKIRQALQ